ncbi:MAG: methyltransferase, partial [Janthinobacterium lividum]
MLRLPGTYRAQGDTSLLATTLLSRGSVVGRRVLDVGTGGGALALAAVRGGASTVTAIDLSLRSVFTARLNGALHRAPLEVLHGDLFAPVNGRRFDVVLANPPYVPAATDALPRHRAGRSWDAGRDGRAVIERICDDVG